MNKLTKIITTAVSLVFFFFLTSSLLQAQPRQERRGQLLPDSTQIVKMVDEMTKTLSLTEKQKIKISELHFAHFQEVKALMEKGKGNRKDNRKVMDEFRKDFEKQVKAQLTDKQKTDYEKHIKNRGPKRGQQMPGRK